jgi:hypothetical protein
MPLVTWLFIDNIYVKTRGYVLAIQDQVISTKNYGKHTLKGERNSDAKRCTQHPEARDHITGDNLSLAAIEYMRQHDTASISPTVSTNIQIPQMIGSKSNIYHRLSWK